MYLNFLKILKEYSSKNKIEILHRGFTKEYAFKKFNLDTKHNTIEQFGERLFFFGEKSKYFELKRFKLKFRLNDESQREFKAIFNIFTTIESDSTPSEFYKNNKMIFDYFDIKNKSKFLLNTKLLSNECKMFIRNYYFAILHQLENNDFKGESFLISSTSDFSQANNFAVGEEGIVINFWNWKSKENICNFKNLPYFNGVPFPNEKEVSIFGAIFPHYIYSFEHKGKLYVNPNLNNKHNFEVVLFAGFEIDQSNFKEKLKRMTAYEFYLEKDINKLEEK